MKRSSPSLGAVIAGALQAVGCGSMDWGNEYARYPVFVADGTARTGSRPA